MRRVAVTDGMAQEAVKKLENAGCEVVQQFIEHEDLVSGALVPSLGRDRWARGGTVCFVKPHVPLFGLPSKHVLRRVESDAVGGRGRSR